MKRLLGFVYKRFAPWGRFFSQHDQKLVWVAPEAVSPRPRGPQWRRSCAWRGAAEPLEDHEGRKSKSSFHAETEPETHAGRCGSGHTAEPGAQPADTN
jgi:hypothetical protein